MAEVAEKVTLKINDYKSDIAPIWCPGCGDFGVVNSIYRSLAELQLQPENVAVVSGIGCSSRLPGYMGTYGFNTVHGRILPIATGIKMANPEITVIGTGGDGDGFSIGMGHIPHAVRRNVDMTYIVMDNEIYGLTKGQLSPTAPQGDITKTSIYGSVETPIEPVKFMLGIGATFVARTYAGNPKHMADIITAGIKHKGFAFIDAMSSCRTYKGVEQNKLMRQNTYYLEDTDYDPTDRAAALEIASDTERFAAGVIYQEEAPTYDGLYADVQRKAQQKGTPEIQDLLQRYVP